MTCGERLHFFGFACDLWKTGFDRYLLLQLGRQIFQLICTTQGIRVLIDIPIESRTQLKWPWPFNSMIRLQSDAA